MDLGSLERSALWGPGDAGLIQKGVQVSMFRSVVLQVENREDLIKARELNIVLANSGQDFEMITILTPFFSEAVQRSGTDPINDGGAVENIAQEFINTRFTFLSGAQISSTSALWAGIDSSIGDRVSVIFSMPEKLDDLSSFWANANNHDVYFGYPNEQSTGRSLMQRLFAPIFGQVYKLSTGRKLENRPIGLADLSRQYVNFLHKTGQPEVALRNSNIFTGFDSGAQTLQTLGRMPKRKTSDLFGRGMEILFSASSSPLRAISMLSLTGAGVNVLYSMYVLFTSLTSSVSEGWTSMSLQISGMFLLTSLVLSMICEFLIYSQQSTFSGSKYFIAKEISSPQFGLNKKLNIAESNDVH